MASSKKWTFGFFKELKILIFNLLYS